jgi:hypothetical protein
LHKILHLPTDYKISLCTRYLPTDHRTTHCTRRQSISTYRPQDIILHKILRLPTDYKISLCTRYLPTDHRKTHCTIRSISICRLQDITFNKTDYIYLQTTGYHFPYDSTPSYRPQNNTLQNAVLPTYRIQNITFHPTVYLPTDYRISLSTRQYI